MACGLGLFTPDELEEDDGVTEGAEMLMNIREIRRCFVHPFLRDDSPVRIGKGGCE
ncbi:MAG: hypothetical protein V1706_14885 [Pseudomonadota bacterium]